MVAKNKKIKLFSAVVFLLIFFPIQAFGHQKESYAEQLGGICPHPDKKPHKSKTKGKHMDEDCCPDPDEWANPKCAYSESGYKLMLNRPK